MEIKKLDGILEEVADTTKFPSSSKEKIQQAITAVNPSRLETDGKGAGLLFQEGQSPDNADNNGMDEAQRQEITEKLETMAVPMEKVEYSQTEYDKLFPRGYVKTPIETVKLGENQFTKLKAKNREYLLSAMHQTLADPIVILNEKREGLISRLYIKPFKEHGKADKFTLSVVVDINNKPISISTSQRRIDQIMAKIKMADSIPYLKGRYGGASPTHGTGGTPESKPPLPGKTSPEGDTIVSHGNGEKSSGNEEKKKSR